jgi:hypothetical protein
VVASGHAAQQGAVAARIELQPNNHRWHHGCRKPEIHQAVESAAAEHPVRSMVEATSNAAGISPDSCGDPEPCSGSLGRGASGTDRLGHGRRWRRRPGPLSGISFAGMNQALAYHGLVFCVALPPAVLFVRYRSAKSIPWWVAVLTIAGGGGFLGNFGSNFYGEYNCEAVRGVSNRPVVVARTGTGALEPPPAAGRQLGARSVGRLRRRGT